METAAEIVAQFTPRVMLEALMQEPEPSRFMLDRHIRKTTTHDTEIIEIDVEKGGQTVAAFVSRVGDANVVGKREFTAIMHNIPYIYEEIPFTAKDIKVRLPGETVYSGSSPAARLSKKIGGWLKMLRDRIVRNKELQLLTAMQTGEIQITGKDVGYTVDFQMDPTHLVTNTGAAIWGSTTEDKIEQLETDAAKSRDKGAPPPTVLYLGIDAAKLWLADSAVLSYMDNRRVQLGQINVEQLAGQRATFLGDFSRVGLNVQVFSYQATYTDTAGATQYYLDPDNYILTTPEARIEEHYSMIENLNHGSYVGKEFPDMIVDPNGRKGKVTLESGPLIGMHQPDAVVRRTVK